MSLHNRKILESAKKDEKFIKLAKQHIEGFPVPNFWSSVKEESLFCLFYVGYLLGKHQDDPEKFLDEEKI